MKKLFFHIHWFNKPIVSRYTSFETRDIIYQCRCGKKVSVEIYRPFSVSFPIETSNLITKEEYNTILKSLDRY